jgi:uncharacterized phage protein gp47/JayE
MPFSRPSLSQLHERIKADIQAHLPGADVELRRGNLGVLAKVHAAAQHTLYGYLERVARQIIIDTAEAEFLERHAGIWGIQRKQAAKASGQVRFTGSEGATIPAGTELRRSDDRRFLTEATATISAGEAVVAVSAVEGGADGDTPANTTLRLVGYLPGVDQAATVTADGLGGGADRESDDALRQRLLARIQQPPAGGAQHDYVAWALEVPGIAKAYCYPQRMGVGTVGVAVLADDGQGGWTIPDQADVDAVAAYIEERRPVTAEVYVFAPEAAPLDFDIRVTPDTSEVRAAVEAELADLIQRESEPEGTILISHIREAISIAAGEHDHTLISPTENVTAGAGKIITMGSITWS